MYMDTNWLHTAYSCSECYSIFVEAIQLKNNRRAGTGNCKQMLQQSGISIHDMQPSRTLESLDRKAHPTLTGPG